MNSYVRRERRTGTRRSLGVAAGLLALTLIVTACGSSSKSAKSTPSDQPPLKLYGVFGLTGPSATIAGELLNGMKVAVQTINDQGGILGRKIEFSYDNDEFDPTKSVSLVQNKVTSSKPDLVYAGTSSAEILPVLQVTNPAKIFTIATGTAPAIGDATKFPYTFGPIPSQDTQTSSVANYITSKGFKNVALITSSDATGTTYVTSYKAAFTKANLNLVDTETFDTTALDMTTQFQRIKSKNPDVIVMSGVQFGSYLVKSRNLAGMTNVPTISDSGTQAQDWVPTVPASALQNITMQVYKVNAASSTSPGITALKANLAKAGVTPKVAFNQYAFSGDVLLAYANAANSLKTLDPDKIRAALESGSYTKSFPTAGTADYVWTPTFHINGATDAFTFIAPSSLKDGQYPAQ